MKCVGCECCDWSRNSSVSVGGKSCGGGGGGGTMSDGTAVNWGCGGGAWWCWL